MTVTWTRTLLIWFALSVFALTSFAETVRVTRIYDGDTVLVETADGKDESVRLVGINAPEWVKKIGGQWRVVADCYAAESSSTLRAIALGNPARLTRTGKDVYGRTLGYLFISPADAHSAVGPNQQRRGAEAHTAVSPDAIKSLAKQSVNRWMVENGLAKTYRRFPHRYERSYIAAENKAKAENRGLWRKCQ
jgi:endonuclease YncB( thermonuclease family)